MSQSSNLIRLLFYVMLVVILSLPIFDISSTMLALRVSVLPRFMLLFLFVFLIIFLYRKVSLIHVVYSYLVAFNFVLFVFIYGYTTSWNLNHELFAVATKFLFPILMFYALNQYFKVYPNDFRKYYNINVTLCYVYLLFIPISMLLGYSEFKTYSEVSGRFGYKGIVSAGNEATGLIFFIAAFFGYRYLRSKSKFDLIIVCITLLISPILGTKGGVLGVLFIVLALVFSRMKPINFFLSIILLAGLIVGFSLFLYSTLDLVRIAVDGNVSYFQYQLERGANGSILSLLLSGRDQKLEYIISQMDGFLIIFLFSGGWDVTHYFVESDLLDTMLVFGFFGTFYIYLFWFKLFVLKNLPSCEIKFVGIVMLGLFVISSTAGHILYSAASSIFAVFIGLYVRHSNYCVR